MSSDMALLRYGVQKHWIKVGASPKPTICIGDVKCLCDLRDSTGIDEWKERQGWNARTLFVPADAAAALRRQIASSRSLPSLLLQEEQNLDKVL